MDLSWWWVLIALLVGLGIALGVYVHYAEDNGTLRSDLMVLKAEVERLKAAARAAPPPKPPEPEKRTLLFRRR